MLSSCLHLCSNWTFKITIEPFLFSIWSIQSPKADHMLSKERLIVFGSSSSLILFLFPLSPYRFPFFRIRYLWYKLSLFTRKIHFKESVLIIKIILRTKKLESVKNWLQLHSKTAFNIIREQQDITLKCWSLFLRSLNKKKSKH